VANLLGYKDRWKEDKWCICGDFNVVRTMEGKKGEDGSFLATRVEMYEFNYFIDTMMLFEAPTVGCQFTWFQSNGRTCSKLDRFLLSSEWIHRDQNYA